MVLFYLSQSAGLPNITGTAALVQAGGTSSPTGAIYTLGTNAPAATAAAAWVQMVHGINASYSNSIYGSSDTVTPLSRKCLFLIRY